MNHLPILADFSKNERHPAGGVFKFGFVLLRLFPLACNIGGRRAEHLDADAGYFERDVFRFGVARFAVGLHRFPADGGRAVVVKKQCSIAVVVNAHHLFGVNLLDAVNKPVKRIADRFGRIYFDGYRSLRRSRCR